MESGYDLRLVFVANYEKFLKLSDSPLVTASYSGIEVPTKLCHQIASIRHLKDFRHSRTINDHRYKRLRKQTPKWRKSEKITNIEFWSGKELTWFCWINETNEYIVVDLLSVPSSSLLMLKKGQVSNFCLYFSVYNTGPTYGWTRFHNEFYQIGSNNWFNHDQSRNQIISQSYWIGLSKKKLLNWIKTIKTIKNL